MTPTAMDHLECADCVKSEAIHMSKKTQKRAQQSTYQGCNQLTSISSARIYLCIAEMKHFRKTQFLSSALYNPRLFSSSCKEERKK
jgi:hypothetical protein